MNVAASPSSWPQRISSPLAEGAQALRNFLRHRDLLWQMVGNDLKGRYVGSVLGLFWSVVHPLVQISIYTLIFSKIMGARLGENASPYAFSVYLCAGMLPWVTCAEVMSRCTGVFWENATLVKKIAFPKVLLYAYVVTAAATNLAIMLIMFLVFLWWVSELPALIPLVTWMPFLVLQLMFATGIGFITSVLNVFFRDVAQITAVFIQLWFWLTPIVYVPDILPLPVLSLLRYNVMARFTSVHHALILRGELPRVEEGIFLLGVSIGTLVLGLACFRALRRRIPDEL